MRDIAIRYDLSVTLRWPVVAATGVALRTKYVAPVVALGASVIWTA
jgi:hypothetical protein